MPGHSAQRRRRRVVRGVAAAAGVAAAVAVVAGCASRSGLAARSDKSVGGAIQFAAAQVVAAKSVHVHGVLSGGASGTVDGAVVFAPAVQGELTLKLSDAADMVPTHVLYDGTTFYTSIPKGYHATSKAKPNASWFAMSATDLVPKNSPVLSMLRSDPAALVKEVLAKGRFTQAGTGTADGVAATHFTGDLAGDTTGHVDVWLDASGLPVEIVFQSAATSASNKQTAGRTELHFSQWGKPVTITPPPADQVLTDQDQISFAISGQQFKVSGDPLNGSTSPQNGGGVIIGAPPSGGAGQATCVPVSLPSPIQPTSTSVCVTFTLPAAPTHT
ncbi:LppX_LprAFG lipoprotein [Catenulispora rubra]|uniref:LppX_LprAFG lipoprotein n=1 Tax=Catenulispora rubra TaxID=280293 RepID=UPI0018920A35|nr:LppX_LprAFG lipoprotein [Catenulispora rubra]